MAPSILIAGATGNTGRSVVETLPKLLHGVPELSSYRILALTRDASSPAAKELAKLPDIEVIEQDWVEIDDQWLRGHEVARVFVASHIQPSQFAEESQFLVNALQAGVKYVVRISTAAPNVRPDTSVYYARTHWAIENMLSQPEFNDMHWTSLQPNGFTATVLYQTVAFIKETRKNGKQSDPLYLLLDQNTPAGLIDAYDVGVVAAHLLAAESTVLQNQKRYVLNGPEDITGQEIVELAKQYIGEPVEDARFKDLSMLDDMVKNTSESKNLTRSLKGSPRAFWEGNMKAHTTSEEILALYTPKRTVAEALKKLVKG